VPVQSVAARGNPDFSELFGGSAFQALDSLGREAERESATKLDHDQPAIRVVVDGVGPRLDSIRLSSFADGSLVLAVEIVLNVSGGLSHGAASTLRGTVAGEFPRF